MIEQGSLDPTALALPPLPLPIERLSQVGPLLHAMDARERILLARIAELTSALADKEAALSGCVDLAEWWINHKREPGMCERDYRTWLALGHRSEALLRAKAAIDAARKA